MPGDKPLDRVLAVSTYRYHLREWNWGKEGSSDDNASILLSAVYRVEVAPDTITVWTILDADPTGTIDYTLDGVTIPWDRPDPKKKQTPQSHIGNTDRMSA